MKKRLRKKKRLGEFKVYGVPVAIKLTAGTDFDSFLDAFILDAIESNGCYVIGGGKKDRFVGFVELGQKCNMPEERLKRISDWFSSRSEVEVFTLGKITDAWYGPFDELDSIGEHI